MEIFHSKKGSDLQFGFSFYASKPRRSGLRKTGLAGAIKAALMHLKKFTHGEEIKPV